MQAGNCPVSTESGLLTQPSTLLLGNN